MSETIQIMISQGVDINTIYLILSLPFIATLIVALRQVVGFESFGIYTPLVLTFALWATGLKYGLAIFIVILLTGTLVRYMLKNLRLMYLPKVAIILSAISLAMLFMMTLGGFLNITGLSSVSILPLLIMITLIEKFISAQMEKGLKTATVLSIQTLIISIVGYYFINWDIFRYLVINYPEYILLLFVVNIFLGKWAGLRLSEYLRFKEIIKSNESNQK